MNNAFVNKVLSIQLCLVVKEGKQCLDLISLGKTTKGMAFQEKMAIAVILGFAPIQLL